jgi:hypothetical protein
MLMDKLIPPAPIFPSVDNTVDTGVSCPGWPKGPCGKRAGTPWTIRWCPECDEKRRAHIAWAMGQKGEAKEEIIENIAYEERIIGVSMEDVIEEMRDNINKILSAPFLDMSSP